jgi:PhnB protein
VVSAQPEGYPTVCAALSIDGAAEAIVFYSKVFRATERMRMDGPGGTIAHAELQIGDSVVMLADEYPDMDFVGPRKLGGTPVSLSVYVDDVDAVFARAVKAGATPFREPEDQFYGDRSAQFIDPWGHRWGIATHIEDVSAEEMQRRAAEMMSG